MKICRVYIVTYEDGGRDTQIARTSFIFIKTKHIWYHSKADRMGFMIHINMIQSTSVWRHYDVTSNGTPQNA